MPIPPDNPAPSTRPPIAAAAILMFVFMYISSLYRARESRGVRSARKGPPGHSRLCCDVVSVGVLADKSARKIARNDGGRTVGGGSGIRTHDTVSRIHAFQASAFSHSAIPPQKGPRNIMAGLRLTTLAV